MPSPGVLFGAMTLGQLIDGLRRLPSEATVWVGSGRYRPTELGSYRGYYEDLALGFDARRDELCTVSDLLVKCVGAVGKDFYGWKGGKYRAALDTAVWAGNQGEANGMAVTGLSSIGERGYILNVDLVDG